MDSAWRSVCAGRGLPAVGSAVSARGVRLPVVRLFLSVVVKNFAVIRNKCTRMT